MRKQIVILTFVLLIFCSASAMADSIDLIENYSVYQMKFTIENTDYGKFQSFTDAGWNFSLSDDKSTLTATSPNSAIPGEFTLDFASVSNGLVIDFTTLPQDVDYAKITFSGGEWAVKDTKDLVTAPEPSLILLLGIGLGAVTLTFWRKKE